MRFLWLYLGLALGVSNCVLSDGFEASTGNQMLPPNQAVLHFDEMGTIELAPSDVKTLSVTATPASSYSIRFALLGDELDASLDQTLVTAGPDGRASVVLHAPSKSTTFSVRASIDGGPSAESEIAVSDHGFGTVRVAPAYAGKRSVKTWTAGVVVRATCADIASTLPGEPPGALVATAKEGDDPVIKSAPVGPNLAVTIRAGHYMWGCTDVTSVQKDTTTEVPVVVVDKPIDLGSTNMKLAFGYVPDPTGYSEILGEASALVTGAVVPPGKTDAQALLDAMAVLAIDPNSFASARSANGWDAQLDQAFMGKGIDLDTKLKTWIEAGVGAQSPSIEATITGNANAATLTIDQIGDLTGDEAGIGAPISVAWGAHPDDTLLLGGVVPWSPTRFVGAAAFHAAQADFPQASTMSEAMSKLVDCKNVASTLGAYKACDQGCVATLCEVAIVDLWKKAIDASMNNGAPPAQITIDATGRATVDDVAAPASLDGLWLGNVAAGMVSAPVQGAFSGMSSMPPPP